MEYQVLLFYKYISLPNPQTVADWMLEHSKKCNLLGRVIVSPEGINATLEGEKNDTENFVAAFIQDAQFADVHVNRSHGSGTTFPKLSVKVRPEIVGTRLPTEAANPHVKTGKRLTADELHAWFEERRDFVVVDMRNDYEYASGHFENSIDPGLRASRDLPKVLPKLEPLKDKTIVTVCTGGVRCEKMSSYLLHKGFSDVYQLDGGIHSYMEQYPEGKFKGTLYTFDGRVTMGFGGKAETIGSCRLCCEKTEKYVNCANTECHLHFLACSLCQEKGSDVYCSPACKYEIETIKNALV